MILSGHEIRARLGGDIMHRPVRRGAAQSQQLQPHAARRADGLRRSRARHGQGQPRAADRDPAGGPGAQPEPALSRPHRRADRDAQPRAADRRPLVDRPARACSSTSRPASATSASRATGRSRCSPCSRSASIPACRSARSSITRSRGEFDEYDSKYQHNRDIQPSLLFHELTTPERDPQKPLDFDADGASGSSCGGVLAASSRFVVDRKRERSASNLRRFRSESFRRRARLIGAGGRNTAPQTHTWSSAAESALLFAPADV